MDRTQTSDSNPLVILSSSFTATVHKAFYCCGDCGLTFYLKNRRRGMQVKMEVGGCISSFGRAAASMGAACARKGTKNMGRALHCMLTPA